MSQNAFYEESAVSLRAEKESKYYTLFRITGIVFFVIAAILILVSLIFVPDVIMNTEGSVRILQLIFWFLLIAVVIFVGVLFIHLKGRFNVSYDYAFVEDELRVTKIFNGQKRKPVAVLRGENILKIGYCDKDSFADTLAGLQNGGADYATPNSEPAEGKRFVYIYYAASSGRSVYVIECKQALLEYLVKAAGVTKFTKQ